VSSTPASFQSPRHRSVRRLALALLPTLLLMSAEALAKPNGTRVTFSPMAGVGVLSEFSGAHDDLYFGGALGFQFSRNFGIEGSLGYVPSIERVGGREVLVRHLSTDLKYQFLPDSRFIPYLTAGWSEIRLDPEGVGGSGTARGFSFGAGLLIPMGDGPFHRWSLRMDFKDALVKFDKVGLIDDGLHHNFMSTIGLQFEFGDDWHKDLDGDGVIDRFDDCLDTPDRVLVDALGCPLDTDQDGIFDGLDECENTPVGALVDSLGCPFDTDSDGVFDGIDQCENTPEGAVIDDEGCPLDTDRDGVFDGLDQCPDTPLGISVDLKGCPRIESEAERSFYRDRILALDDVRFRPGKTDVTSGVTATIRTLARNMEKWPNIRVEIAGYTDSYGGDANNLQLSQSRADAVRDFLIEKYDFITADRIVSVGYGEANPVADNNTEEGRELNRRVEAKLLEGGPSEF
jgi:OmpA-OmpF porin, OOP family